VPPCSAERCNRGRVATRLRSHRRSKTQCNALGGTERESPASFARAGRTIRLGCSTKDPGGTRRVLAGYSCSCFPRSDSAELVSTQERGSNDRDTRAATRSAPRPRWARSYWTPGGTQAVLTGVLTGYSPRPRWTRSSRAPLARGRTHTHGVLTGYSRGTQAVLTGVLTGYAPRPRWTRSSWAPSARGRRSRATSTGSTCHAALCHAALRHTAVCHAALFHAAVCHEALSHAALRCDTPHHGALRPAALRCRRALPSRPAGTVTGSRRPVRTCPIGHRLPL
jgi:hypothetical protein